MKVTGICLEVLALAVEDYFLLWEVEQVIRNSHPEVPPSGVRSKTRTAIVRLVQEGLVGLFLGTSFAGEEQLLPADKVEHLLETDAYWDPDRNLPEPSVRVGATRKGEELYDEAAWPGPAE